MTTKITVAEWVEYLKWINQPDSWPRSVYVDDTLILLDGHRIAEGFDTHLAFFKTEDQNSEIKILNGQLYDETGPLNSLEEDFNNWRKKFKIDIREELKGALRSVGYHNEMIIDTILEKFNVSKK
jgi:hypothetical protein